MATSDDFAGVYGLSFDCYGTLIDWERGIGTELERWARRHDCDTPAAELVELVGSIESSVQQEHPEMRYPDVLATVLQRVGDRLGVEVRPIEAAEFGASVGRWPAFPDSADALARLSRRFRLVVLSNIDRDSFAASNERLGVEFDLVVTAEDVGSYKPDPRNFDVLIDSLATIDLEREELVHVAQSLYHDHEPARRIGLRTVWIDRRHDQEGFGGTPPPSGAVQPDWRFESMSAFADAVLG